MNRFVDGCSASGANEEVAGVGMSALPEFDDAPEPPAVIDEHAAADLRPARSLP
jgi:hypothetical protein